MDLELKPLRGLWRTPNELAAPPGSCRTLDGCCIRKAGVIEPLPDLQDTGYSTDDFPVWSADVPDGVGIDQATHDKILGIWDSSGTLKTRWIDKSSGSATAIALTDTNDPTYEEGCAHMAMYRGRIYLTSKEGLLVLDATADAVARRAGFPAPNNWYAITEVSTRPQAVSDGKFVAYRAILERELSDGTLIQSAPMTPLLYENDSGGTRNVDIQLGWEAGSGEAHEELVAGDFAALYRTDEADTASTGDVMRLVKRVELTSTDISNQNVTITDDVPQAQLGGELYSNPGQLGSDKAYTPAPYLRDVVYLNDTFLGIAYQEAQSYTLRIPGAFGSLSTDAHRATGIGRRTVTGDTSSGTDTIANVSASHMLGIAVGQKVVHADFPAGTQVLSASGSTITVDNNATGSTVGASVLVDDVLELDGTEISLTDPSELFDTGNSTQIAVQYTEPVGMATQHVGLEMTLFKMRAGNDVSTFGIRGTNGSFYSPNIPLLSETAATSSDAEQGNRLAWSEPGQPEHWPLINRLTFGEGETVRLIRVGDSAYAFNTDARVYRITGAGDGWRVDQVAENLLLLTANSVIAYEGTILAWTDRGLVAIRDGFVQSLSDPRLTDDMKAEYFGLNSDAPWTWDGSMGFDRFNKELWFNAGGGTEGIDKPWIYNVETDEFSRMPTAEYAWPFYVESIQKVFIHWRDPAQPGGGANWVLREFVEYDDGSKLDSTTIELNRVDGGSAGTLKRWRELVILFAQSAAVSQSVTVTTTADKQVGGSSDSTTYTAVLDADEPRQLLCPISRQTGMSAQQRIKLATTTAAGAWAIEGIVARAELLTDRTGARA